jgi:hypothetical protein
MGDRDHTFEWLEEASAERSGRLEYIKGEDFLDSDPRYIDLLRCVLQNGMSEVLTAASPSDLVEDELLFVNQ